MICIKNCGARLDPVLDSIKLYHKLGIWTEITTLIIPKLNNSETNLRQIAKFIKDIDPQIPWHISRFYPMYKLDNKPPTPIDTLRKAKQIGQKIGLKHIYIGNAPGEGDNTYCPNCSTLLIRRVGYSILENHIVNSKCSKCGLQIKGYFN